jgi:hypothetical protein
MNFWFYSVIDLSEASQIQINQKFAYSYKFFILQKAVVF